MKTFVASDQHFDHGNIIKHCDRPFSNVDEMNDTLVGKWNEVVTSHDRVIVVGDFAWKNPEYWLNKLNGTKILIKGNHDHKQNRKGWDFVKDIWETSIEGQRVVFCHYQMAEWNASFHGSWHLYGHSHGNAEEYEHKLSFDVGVDLWDFYPIEWSQIQKKMHFKESMRKIWQSNRLWIPGKNRIKITENNKRYWK
jgi:calcineurin-like phosphoesterase family protein